MKHKILILSCLLCAIMAIAVSYSQTTESLEESTYLLYIDNPILDYSLARAKKLEASYNEDIFSDTKYSLEKAILLFRIAVLTFEEKEVVQAFEYWKSLYELPSFKNPVHFAYLGTLESMHAGAINKPQPILKTKLAKQGLEKIAIAIEELSPSNDAMALAYVYFLEGNTKSSLPDFFKEFDEAPKSLNLSIKQLSKARKQQIYSEELLYFLVSYNYAILGDFYLKKGKTKSARKFYTTAKKYLTKIEADGNLFNNVQAQIQLLQ